MSRLRYSLALTLTVVVLLCHLAGEIDGKQHFKHKHNMNEESKGKQKKEAQENNEEKGGDQMAPEFGISGREYRFRFDSQTTSGYASWISTQRSMSRFQALVSVKFGGDNKKEATMYLSECLAGQLNGKPPVDSWKQAEIQPIEAFETSSKFQHEHLERPVRFSYEQGKIDKIWFSPEDPAWSKNIKKAVLSMLQVQMAKAVVQQQRDPLERRIDRELAQQTGTVGGKVQQQQISKQQEREQAYYQIQKSFTQNEVTVEGECKCQYTVVPMFGGAQLNVTKSIDFDSCKSLADIAYGMQADQEVRLRGDDGNARQTQQDRMAHLALNEQIANAEWRNRSGSPVIAKQVLDRSTTIRYVLTNTQAQKQYSGKKEEQFGLDSPYGIQQVELVSQYVLKGSEAESSQAMQTVAAAQLCFLNAKSMDKKSKKTNNAGEVFDPESETLTYNPEMEAQEKCFFMFGDDTSDQNRQCSAATPFPYNYPNSGKKVAHAAQLLKAVATALQQQGTTDQQAEQQRSMDTAESMDELIQILRYCTEKELTMLMNKNDLSDSSRQFLADALAAASTRNTLKVLLGRIESGEFTDLRAAQLMKIFSRGSGLPAPSDKIADLVLALCKSGKVQKSAMLKQTCWLSFGAIVGELNNQLRITRYSPVFTPSDEYESCPEHKMELYTKALLEQFTKSSDEQLHDKVVALKAIGNAALDSVPQELIDCIATDKPEEQKQSQAIRTNAIEALRRIPSSKVYKILLPVYLNQAENHYLRIFALSVMMQSQLPPPETVLDQIAYAMSQENCPQVLSYTLTTMQEMAHSPAKKHQQISQHVMAALRLAGVDQQELAEKCRGMPSHFKRTSFYSAKEQSGLFLESANVFHDKNAGSIPNHVFISLSSLLNGQFTEEKLKLTLCQWNVDKFFQSILEENDSENGGESSQNGKKNESNKSSAKASYLSLAQEQLKSVWSRLKGISRSGKEAEERRFAPAVVASLRVNNIDTISIMIGGPESAEQSPVESLKQMLVMAGVSSAADYANGVEKSALEANGILYWQERAARVATSVGTQLNIQMKSGIFGQLRANLRQMGSAQFSMEFRPALAYMGLQKMKTWASPAMANGVKRVVAVEATIPIKAQLTVQPQQQQIKLTFRVPQSSTRIFSFHTLPSTFICETDTDEEQSALANNENRNAIASGLHFAEQIRSVQNQQLRGYQFAVDKTAFESVGMPVHAKGILHKPRNWRQLKEWAKVLFASENHYHVDFEPQQGSTPRELAHTIHWETFTPHSNTPGVQMRTQLRQILEKFERNIDGDQQQLSAEEDESAKQSAIESKVKNAQTILSRLAQQKAFKHVLKYTLETVGGEQNKRAEAQLETICTASHIACDVRTQMKYFDNAEAKNDAADWQANVKIQTILTLAVIDLDRMSLINTGRTQEQQKKDSNQHFQMVIQTMDAEWGTSGQQKQSIKAHLKGEPSDEMMTMLRDFIYANRTFSGLGTRESNSLLMRVPKNAERPFVNNYQLVADYKLDPETAIAFIEYLELAKAKNFMNTESHLFSGDNSKSTGVAASNNNENNNKKQQQQGQVRVDVSIDPVTRQHLNATVQTEAQLVKFKQIRLVCPIRPIPLQYVPLSIRSAQSVQQLFQQQIAHQLRSRAECRLDTRRKLLQTFDGIQSPAPISNCWTVLAKYCGKNMATGGDSYNGAPQFAILIKSVPGTQQKQLKMISSDMGVMVVEPRSEQPNEDDDQEEQAENKLQVRILNGQQSTITSDSAESEVPEGIEFALGGPSGRETVIIESEQAHVQVRFNGQTVRIQLRGAEYQEQQCGLCGNWDQEAANDWQTLPSGGHAQNVQQFQRAYAIEDEEQPGCTQSALDEFYAQQANTFRGEWGGETGEQEKQQQAKGQQNPRKQNSDGQESEEKGEEIEPQQRTKVIEHAHQLCFSVRPVTQCLVGSYATIKSSTDDAAAGPKKQKVPFTCLQRASLEAKRLMQQARRGEAIELTEYPASFQEVVIVPERCINY